MSPGFLKVVSKHQGECTYGREYLYRFSNLSTCHLRHTTETLHDVGERLMLADPQDNFCDSGFGDKSHDTDALRLTINDTDQGENEQIRLR